MFIRLSRAILIYILFLSAQVVAGSAQIEHCEDFFDSLDSYEAWPDVAPETDLTKPTLRMVTRFARKFDDVIARTNPKIKLMASPYTAEDMRLDPLIKTTTRKGSFFIRTIEAINYAEPWCIGDADLIHLSDVHDKPHETFRIAILDGDNTVRSEPELTSRSTLLTGTT